MLFSYFVLVSLSVAFPPVIFFFEQANEYCCIAFWERIVLWRGLDQLSVTQVILSQVISYFLMGYVNYMRENSGSKRSVHTTEAARSVGYISAF